MPMALKFPKEADNLFGELQFKRVGMPHSWHFRFPIVINFISCIIYFVWQKHIGACKPCDLIIFGCLHHQVRYLDFYLRWSVLIRPEQIQDVKGQETEASAFRNANICDKKLVEGKICYGIAFGSQKHLPSRVMKNIVEIEQGPEGKEKYWFSETRIPIYLIKEYEEANEKVPCDEEHYGVTSQLDRRRLKCTSKDIFFYLVCKRDNVVFLCSACQMAVSIR